MVLSAILNLGNIQFIATADGESCCIEIDSRKFLCNAAALLKVHELKLESAITSHSRKIGSQKIT